MFKILNLGRRAERSQDIGLDFHSHLLPGVDDGVADLAEARKAIAALRRAGFSGAVVTPHIFKGVYDNSSAGLTAAFADFAADLAAEPEPFALHLAAEYFADDNFLEMIKADDLLSLRVGGERWVLLEFPSHREAPTAAICVAALAARGYRPVIAHVERYLYVARGRTVWLSRFTRSRAILQGDIGSLAGQHGEEVRRFALWLLDRQMIQIWGSDLHHPEQMERFIAPGLAELAPRGHLNQLLDPVLAATAPRLAEVGSC